jgi:hypothetical protein
VQRKLQDRIGENAERLLLSLCHGGRTHEQKENIDLDRSQVLSAIRAASGHPGLPRRVESGGLLGGPATTIHDSLGDARSDRFEPFNTRGAPRFRHDLSDLSLGRTMEDPPPDGSGRHAC